MVACQESVWPRRRLTDAISFCRLDLSRLLYQRLPTVPAPQPTHSCISAASPTTQLPHPLLDPPSSKVESSARSSILTGMRYLSKSPGQPLGDFVERLWHFSDAPGHSRERIVPSGTIE